MTTVDSLLSFLKIAERAIWNFSSVIKRSLETFDRSFLEEVSDELEITMLDGTLWQLQTVIFYRRCYYIRSLIELFETHKLILMFMIF